MTGKNSSSTAESTEKRGQRSAGARGLEAMEREAEGNCSRGGGKLGEEDARIKWDSGKNGENEEEICRLIRMMGNDRSNSERATVSLS